MKTLTDGKLMEILDFGKMAELAGNGGKDEVNPGASTVVRPLKGSKRYYYYLTEDSQVAVWDLALRKTVRILKARTSLLPYFL